MSSERLLTPYGYGTQRVSLGWLRAKLLENYHPEYVARLIGWLDHKGGRVGVGGGFRPDGTQPDLPGFAPAGKSFHQNQRYDDGFVGACAVDLVLVNQNPAGIHVGIPWSEVPQQGSVEAGVWGVHCNVGYPGKVGAESWHMQPVEIDGHDSWVAAGSPAPVPDYPFPGRQTTMTPHDPVRVYDTRQAGGAFTAGESRLIPIAMGTSAHVGVTAIGKGTRGYVSVSPTGDFSTSVVNFTATGAVAGGAPFALAGGHLHVFASQACEIVLDVFATGR